jgi:spore maturation protein CgeB
MSDKISHYIHSFLYSVLVQESCPVFHRYFVEGEHFLEFSDCKELATIIEFLRLHPKTAHAVCSQGHRFYKEKYSCKKLVEHFQTFL